MYKKWFNILLVSLLFLLLVSVRFYENIFYDPLATYFENDYLHKSLPDINKGKLFFHIFLRYYLNAIISILIIWVAFRKKSYVIFSIFFYDIAFVVLIIIFWFVVSNQFENHYLFGFYIRRFLIQPLFVLLLLPAFYYQLKHYNPSSA